MKKVYRFKVGLKKGQMGLAQLACVGCKRVNFPLRRLESKGTPLEKRTYACPDCVKLYKERGIGV